MADNLTSLRDFSDGGTSKKGNFINVAAGIVVADLPEQSAAKTMPIQHEGNLKSLSAKPISVQNLA
jgi:hypothetical protein